MATTRSSWRTCAKIDLTQAATVVLPIRVGRVVVTTISPDGVSWSCCNCATIFTRTR
jgi:hypothetical protein